MGYGLFRALPGVHDVLVTVIGAMQSIVANLAPAKGRQDHTAWPSARKVIRLMTCGVHRIPLPTFVTIAIRPSLRRRDGAEHAADLGSAAIATACGTLTRRAM